MPPLPDVPSVLRVSLRHELSFDLDVLSRIFLQYSGTAPTNTGLSSMASSIETAWASHLAPLAPGTVHLTEIVIEDLTTPSSAIGTWVGSTAGTRSGSYLPAGTCMLVNFQVARRYRGGKPRIYSPWGVQGDLGSAQEWNTTFQGAALAGYNAWIAAAIAAAPSGTSITGQVNVSYYEGFTVVTSPTTGRARNVPTLRTVPLVDAIIAAEVPLGVASQRRRNRSGL